MALSEEITDTDGDGMPDDWEAEHGLDPNYDESFSDNDYDGLTNLEEYQNNSDPNDSDTDDDGMPDDWEVEHGLDPNYDDSWYDNDYDGLYNIEEFQNTADPNDSDTDDDGIDDYSEVWIYGTNPAKKDTDDDGLEDNFELMSSLTDPCDSDTDDDGVLDGVEYVNLMDPFSLDTDGDGLFDFWEMNVGAPLFSACTSDSYDVDDDGLPDMWENFWFGLLKGYYDDADDTDGDGFSNLTELGMGTDPAFSVSTVSTSIGRYGLSWTQVLGATNYHVRILLEGETQERIIDTNVCSLVIVPAGSNVPSYCSYEVSAYDPYASTTRVVNTYFLKPSNPNLKAWKVCDPFQVTPTTYPYILGEQRKVFEKTFEVNQNSRWPRQFYLSADPDGWNGSLGSEGGVQRVQVFDDTGMNNDIEIGSSISLPVFVQTGENASWITVRIFTGPFPWESPVEDPPFEHDPYDLYYLMDGPQHLDIPLYLLGWAPGIVFDGSVPAYELPDGTKVLLSTNTPLAFTVDYNGAPMSGSSCPLDKYVAPFGNTLPYGAGSPSYTTEDGHVTGGSLPPGPSGETGAYDLDPYFSGGGSWSTIGDAINYYLSFLNFVPERIKERRPRFLPGAVCSVHHDFSGVGKGEFPLDTQCLYEGMLNGYLLDPAGDETDVEEETGFYYPAFPGNEWLSYDPAIYFWKPGETVKTVQAKFTYMGVTIPLGSANVTRTGTGTEEPVSGANLCGEYSWDGPGGCSACGRANCSECVEKPELHSVGFRIPLGFTGYKTLSGILWFNVKSNAVVVTPSMFSVMSNSTVQATFENNTLTVGCDKPGGRKVIVSPISYGVKVEIFNNWADATPSRLWKITNDPSSTQKVHFVKYDGASENSPKGIDELFEYITDRWTRTDNRTMLHESLQETVVDGVTTTTRLMLGGGPQGMTNSGTITVSQIVGSGAVSMARDTLSAEWDGMTGSWRVTSMSYWDERTGGPGLVGLPKFRQQPDGSWEYRAYDADGRETIRVLARSASVPAFVTNSIIPAGLADFANAAGLYASVTVSGYENAESEMPSARRNPRSMRSYEILGGAGATLTGSEWHGYTEETTNGWGAVCHRTERAAAQGASKGTGGNPVSIERSYADDPGVTNLPPVLLCGRPLSRSGEDGSVTTWDYAFVVINETQSNLVVTTRHGFSGAPVGVAYRTTYEVETLDVLSGNTLRSETRLYTAGGVTPDPVLSSVTHALDANGRVLSSLYSDGTSISNIWGCCQIDETIGRDGIKNSNSTVATNGYVVTISAKQWMVSLPGTESRYTVTETYADGLGRETNSTTYVCRNGSADLDFEPLVSLTSYPRGTSNYRVSVSPSGVETVSRSYTSGGWEVDETWSAGVTSVVRRASGGLQTVSEKIWTDTLTGQPAWTCETNSTSWLSDGCRVETVTSGASDCEGSMVTSQTVYDFLGRMIATATPLGVSSNVYENARLVKTSRTGMPDTLYFYDSMTGEQRDTVTDVNGDGDADYAGPDRVTRSETFYALANSAWWRVTTNLVWNQANSATPLASGVSRERMTGLGTAAPGTYSGVLTAQSQSFNWKGAVTTSSTYTDAHSNSVWQVTDVPDSNIDAVSKVMGGQVVKTWSSTGITSSFDYDGFGRPTAFKDGRSNTSVTHYNSLGQVDFTEDAALNRTSYAYDGLGRRTAVTNALGGVMHTAYDALGQPLATWGAKYPVAFEYDTAGRMTAMYTWRGTNEITSASQLLGLKAQMDRTSWLYDGVTGLLTNKVYADGKGPSYTYTTGGRLQTRTWARGVVTEYGYDSLGQLVSVNYSDGTPSVTNTYDRLGRKLSAITAVSTNTFEYSGFELYAENQNNDRIRRTWNAEGQPYYTFVNPVSDANPDTAQYYAYQDFSESRIRNMRFKMPACGKSSSFQYYYAEGLDRVGEIDCYNNEETFKMVRLYSYESQRDLASSVTNTSFLYDYGIGDYLPKASMSYDYANDAIGRRTNRVDTLPTSLTVTNAFGYNVKSEVTSAAMANGESIYDYDSIGNRLFAALGAATNSYTANALNQYSVITDPGNTVNPVYDLDGNIITNGVWSFRWDAENRMVAAYSNDALLVVNIYNDQSRRIRKVTAQGTRTFLYDGWNPIREIRSQSSEVSTNYYCWGTDLSGSLQGAGGVGGLLAVMVDGPAPATYYPCYDANGNVTAYVDEFGIVQAEYAYDAFGQTISPGVDLASTFSHRFSTKYADDETGLYYYGYRYYAPGLGRWVSRDPIGEIGGDNLYSFSLNDLQNEIDSLGLKTVIDCSQGECKFNTPIKYDYGLSFLRELAFYEKVAESLRFTHKNYIESGFRIFTGWRYGDVVHDKPKLESLAKTREEAIKRYVIPVEENWKKILDRFIENLANGDYNQDEYDKMVRSGTKNFEKALADANKKVEKAVLDTAGRGTIGSTLSAISFPDNGQYSNYHSHPTDHVPSKADVNSLRKILALEKGSGIRKGVLSKPNESYESHLTIYGTDSAPNPSDPNKSVVGMGIDIYVKYGCKEK
jgi:RHS repeat-associated protein